MTSVLQSKFFLAQNSNVSPLAAYNRRIAHFHAFTAARVVFFLLLSYQKWTNALITHSEQTSPLGLPDHILKQLHAFEPNQKRHRVSIRHTDDRGFLELDYDLERAENVHIVNIDEARHGVREVVHCAHDSVILRHNGVAPSIDEGTLLCGSHHWRCLTRLPAQQVESARASMLPPSAATSDNEKEHIADGGRVAHSLLRRVLAVQSTNATHVHYRTEIAAFNDFFRNGNVRMVTNRFQMKPPAGSAQPQRRKASPRVHPLPRRTLRSDEFDSNTLVSGNNIRAMNARKGAPFTNASKSLAKRQFGLFFSALWAFFQAAKTILSAVEDAVSAYLSFKAAVARFDDDLPHKFTVWQNALQWNYDEGTGRAMYAYSRNDSNTMFTCDNCYLNLQAKVTVWFYISEHTIHNLEAVVVGTGNATMDAFIIARVESPDGTIVRTKMDPLQFGNIHLPVFGVPLTMQFNVPITLGIGYSISADANLWMQSIVHFDDYRRGMRYAAASDSRETALIEPIIVSELSHTSNWTLQGSVEASVQMYIELTPVFMIDYFGGPYASCKFTVGGAFDAKVEPVEMKALSVTDGVNTTGAMVVANASLSAGLQLGWGVDLNILHVFKRHYSVSLYAKQWTLWSGRATWQADGNQFDRLMIAGPPAANDVWNAPLSSKGYYFRHYMLSGLATPSTTSFMLTFLGDNIWSLVVATVYAYGSYDDTAFAQCTSTIVYNGIFGGGAAGFGNADVSIDAELATLKLMPVGDVSKFADVQECSCDTDNFANPFDYRAAPIFFGSFTKNHTALNLQANGGDIVFNMFRTDVLEG